MKVHIFALLIVLAYMSCTHQDNEEINAYSERYRPQLHFTPPSQWMNDPNGLVYLDGEYHLFYQHYPDSNVWGPMHWGHAVSNDLVHWKHLPIALYPDSLGYIFSGSAVYDEKNTSGLGTESRPPLIAIFTHHDTAGLKSGTNTFQYQSIAYSLDKGRTWTKYDANPVLQNPGIIDFRDPKVMWFEEGNSWIMTLAVKDRIHFYSSINLLDWTFLSEFGVDNGAHGGVWECPDLFQLKVDETDYSKWVLLVSINPGGPNGGSATQYFIGEFDGTAFVPDADFELTDGTGLWLDYGRDNYAGVTWNNIPSEDGRRLFIGWMSNWDYANVVPTYTWRSAMTLPRELSLANTSEGFRVSSMPISNLNVLRKDRFEFPTGRLTSGAELLHINPSDNFLFEFKGSFPASDDIEFHLGNDHGDILRFGYKQGNRQFYVDRSLSGANTFSNDFSPAPSVMPRISLDDTIHLHAFIDLASIELFFDGGTAVMTEIFFSSQPLNILSNGKDEEMRHYGINAWTLKSIWQK